MTARWRRPHRAAERGAALIVLMALLAMGVLYFLTAQLEAVSLYQKEAQQGGGSGSLIQAREALLGYATTYRDNNADEIFGYLPCPDTTGDGIADTVLNSGECGSSGHASIGLLPYRTLGLPDLRDAEGNCLWYAVSGNFKAALTKPVPMNWDTQGQFSVLDANAASLVAPDDNQGGAAAVIFSSGAPLGAQNRSTSASGPCGVDPSQISAYLEGGYSFATGNTIALTQGPVKDANGNVTGNDRLAWITPRDIFDRVLKRKDFNNALAASPPGQINTLTDRIKTALELRIQNDIFNGTATSLPMNQANYSPKPSGIYTGEVDPAMDIGVTNQPSYANYLTNWSEQFRLAVCDNLSAPCLDINNNGTANCRGTLMLGGRTADGRPRTSAQKGSSLSILANYFESGSSAGGLDLLTGSGKFAGRTTYAEPASLAGASWSGGTATVTTSSAHGFATDFQVTISGASPGGYNGTYKIAVTDATHFTFALAANPGSYVSGGGAFSSSADVAACLGYGTYVSFAQNIASFASGVQYSGATPIAAVNAGTQTATLGDTGGGAGAGCIWYPAAIPLSTSLRLYFRFQIATKGDGFAVALADGATNLAPNSLARTQIMCGAASSSRLGYAGSPSGSAPGIEKPKLGIEFDTLYSASRSDPPGDHMAFLYWGTTTDGDGGDDNTHYLGSGGVAVTNAVWAGGTATLTTASPHGFAAGQAVLVSGLTPIGYNGTVTISGPTTNQFSYVLTTNPGAYASGGQAKASVTGSAPRNPRVATAALNAPVTIASTSYNLISQRASILTSTKPGDSGISAGRQVVVSGVSQTEYNGTFKVSSVSNVVPYLFRYGLASSIAILPGSGGAANKVTGTELSGLAWAGGTASATSPAGHGLTTLQNITTSGMTPGGFGTTASLTLVDATHFTYPLGTDPAGTFATESPAGMAMVKSSDINLPHSASTGFPTATNIHVRLDLNRSYDATNHVAVLNMKAYIGDTFPLADACGTTEFKNLSAELSALCPSRTVTLQQDAIPINALAALAGAAWSSANQLVTVTTAAAHGLVSGSGVTISGATPVTYNGTFTITVTGTHTFTYPAAANPGSYASGGDISPCRCSISDSQTLAAQATAAKTRTSPSTIS